MSPEDHRDRLPSPPRDTVTRRTIAANGGGSDIPEMPPKLFQLRDLHHSNTAPKTPAACATRAGVTSDEPRGASLQQDCLSDVHDDSRSANACAPFDSQETGSNQRAHNSDARYSFASPDETEASQEKARALEQRTPSAFDETPAGRGWAESILSHRKALVLLLIVIGAAFWTGYRKSDSTPEQLAQDKTSSEPSPDSFVDSGVVDLGAEQSLEPVAPASNAPASNALASNALASNTLASNTLASNTPTISAPSDPTASDSVAAASPPLSPPTSGAMNSITPIPSSVNARGFEVITVSSQTPHTPQISAPSLDDLDQAAQEAAASLESSSFSPSSDSASSVQPSNTPFGPEDWLEYLPPIQAENN